MGYSHGIAKPDARSRSKPAEGHMNHPVPHRRTALALCVALALCAPGARAANKKNPHPGEHDVRRSLERSRVLMGTMCTMTAEGADSSWIARALSDGFSQIDRLDTLINSWREGSELTRLNAAGAEIRTTCSPELYAAIDSAMTLAQETDGAFDPSVEPLLRAWDVRGPGRVPAFEELNDARQRVGWKMVQAERSMRTVRFRRDGMGIDLGSLARGYAIDQVAELLRTRRLSRVMLDFGDESVAFSDGDAWMIEITDPTDATRPALHLVLRRGALSTASSRASGTGGRMSPLFDAESGRPLDLPANVTVVARSATRAAGLAVALLRMGREHAEAFMDDHRDLGAVWLEKQNGELRVWRWNLPSVSAAPGVRIDWRQ
jgi:thiamine biosynthesis lipoprotein